MNDVASRIICTLALVPANPLTNIEALQDVLMVMSNGRVALKRIPFGVTAR